LRKRQVSLLELAVRRVGWRKGMRSMVFAASWCIVSDDKGEAASMADYCEFWNQPTASAYREREAFMEAFPEHSTPEFIWLGAWQQAKERITNRKRSEVAAAVLGGMPA
jgi:hypothetical protein